MNSNSTEFTSRDGRKFGLQVGTAFLLLGALFLWRDHNALAGLAGALGGFLWVAGLILPAHLGPIYRGWMALALAISKVTTPIFMGIIYYLVLTPMGLVIRAIGRNPLKRTAVENSYWVATDSNRTDMTRQF